MCFLVNHIKTTGPIGLMFYMEIAYIYLVKTSKYSRFDFKFQDGVLLKNVITQLAEPF